MADFRKLQVWEKAHALALGVHQVGRSLTAGYDFAFRDQLIRAAISVPANIVEGSARGGDREFARFVRIALGSASELEYLLIFGHDTGSITQADSGTLSDQLVDVRKMLSGLLKRLEASDSRKKKRMQLAGSR